MLVSINISRKRGTKKKPVKEAIVNMHGIKGDAHAGKWHRQISLLREESIEEMRKKGIKIGYGDFAENLTIKGISFQNLKTGSRIKIGEVLFEITQIGKKCHTDCEIKKITGKCIMPSEGIFARVIKGGKIKVGDAVRVEN